MVQSAQEERAERVPIGAFVDRERDELVQLARERDRSVSPIIRRALAAERSAG
jgi:hypothetical protein